MRNIYLKIALCGDEKVGKTAIAKQYSENNFLDNYKMTIASDFITKDITIGNFPIKLQIWDFGGSDRFADLRPMYYKGLKGAVFIFDLGNRQSFENLDKWFNEVRPDEIGAKYIIVGNKSDLIERKVTTDEGRNYASKRNTDYFEISAKTGDNIAQVFETLAEKIIAPVVEAVKPTVLATEPVTITSEPVTTTPEPVTTTPEPVTTTPEPVTTTPEPVTTTPEPVTTTPEPVTTTPEPVTTTPEPVITTPEPVTTTSEPVTTTPEQVTTTPSISTPIESPSIPETISTTSQPQIENVEEILKNNLDGLMILTIKSDYQTLNEKISIIEKIESDNEKETALRLIKILIKKSEFEGLDENSKYFIIQARISLHYLLSNFFIEASENSQAAEHFLAIARDMWLLDQPIDSIIEYFIMASSLSLTYNNQLIKRFFETQDGFFNWLNEQGDVRFRLIRSLFRVDSNQDRSLLNDVVERFRNNRVRFSENLQYYLEMAIDRVKSVLNRFRI